MIKITFNSSKKIYGVAGYLLLTAALPLFSQAQEIIAAFPLDTDPGWNTQGDWEFGQPLGNAGDPTSGYTGTNVYGYNLAGAYTNFPAPHWLTTTAIDCSQHENVTLKFRRWIGLDGSVYPMAAIQASNNGSDWSMVWMYNSTEPLIDTFWKEMSYDISDIADGQSTVYVQWAMGSHDPIITNGGWNIDDVEFEGTRLNPLDLTPALDWSTSAFEGSAADPANTSYTLTNRSATATLEWVAQTNVQWLSIAPVLGTLPPGTATNLTVSVNTTNLLPGTYLGEFSIDNQVSTQTISQAVTLNVQVVPGQIAVEPLSGFVVTNRLGRQQSRSLMVSNSAEYGSLEFSLNLQQTGYTFEIAPPPAPVGQAAMSLSLPQDSLQEHFTFDQPQIRKENEYDTIYLQGLEEFRRTGAPVVPVQPVTLSIPPGRTVKNITVSVLEQDELTGIYNLPPAQGLVAPNDPETVGVVTPDPAIYSVSENWPGINGETIGIHDRRGETFANVNLYPVQYNPVLGKIAYATQMQIEIELNDLNPVRANMNVSLDEPFSLLPSGGPFKHIIITSAAFEAAPSPWNFQALRNRRTAEGIPSTIVTTEWIYSTYDGTRPDGGTDNPTRIRNFLIDAYENWGTEYALIGGGIATVPARMFWVDSLREDYPQYRETEMPVDMYYGCLSPSACTFDSNSNGVYGEPIDGIGGGDVDLVAEVYVGRAPVENVVELANFVRKTLAYANSNDPALHKKVSMAGEWLGFDGPAEYAKDMIEQVRLGGEYDGYSTVGFANHTRGDIPALDLSNNLYDKDLEANGDPRWDKYDFAALMNSGLHIINGLGHADETKCFKMLTSELSLLTNTNYPFIYSQACETGAFDTPDCFAEEIIAMENGVFATVMNARFGWGVRNSTYCPSNRFNRQFWNSVLDKGKMELGKANQDAKEDLLWDINGPAIRWSYYEVTLFGDPAQRLHFPYVPEWLSANPTAAEGLRPGDATLVDVVFDATGTTSGSYTGEITIASNDLETPELTVPVIMVVLPDDLSITPKTDFWVSGQQGALAFPQSTVYTLTNSGSIALDFQTLENSSWLDVAPASGTLAPGSETGIVVSVNSAANFAGPGTYSAIVTFSNATTGALFNRTVDLEIAQAAPAAFLTFNFDSDPGWIPSGDWAFGEPQGLEGDPMSGKTGTNVYGYNLAGAYSNNLPMQWLTTTALDCSDQENVELSFQRWLGIENASNDHAAIEVSTNGQAWSSVWNHSGETLTNEAWQAVSYDISAIADGASTVYIRWGMGTTDATNTFAGWNIDDVELIGQSTWIDTDADSLPDDWEFLYFGTNAVPYEHGDSDPYNNMTEYIAGTDPTDPDSYFRVSDIRSSAAGEFTIEWDALEGRYYDLYWSTNLLHGFQPLELDLEQGSYTGTIPTSLSGSFFKIDARMK